VDSKEKNEWVLNKAGVTRMWPMPNVMAALPKTGGDLCSMPQSFADAY